MKILNEEVFEVKDMFTEDEINNLLIDAYEMEKRRQLFPNLFCTWEGIESITSPTHGATVTITLTDKHRYNPK